MHAIVHARFDEDRIKKMSRIQAATGLTISQILRRLVDAAEVSPLEIIFNSSANSNTGALVAETKHAGVVS